jgi:hypothetical protein
MDIWLLLCLDANEGIIEFLAHWARCLSSPKSCFPPLVSQATNWAHSHCCACIPHTFVPKSENEISVHLLRLVTSLTSLIC